MGQGLLQSTKDADDKVCWHGHRLLCMDGTGVSMPDDPQLARRFGKGGGIKEGCGFPVAHLLVMIHAGTGLILEILANCYRTHDARLVIEMLKHFRPGDVLLADRGFCSFVNIALILQGKSHALMRAHQRLVINFKSGRKCRKQLPKSRRAGAPGSRFIKSLGPADQLVSYNRSGQRPSWLSIERWEQLPGQITVRELRYRITCAGYRTRCVTLVTTLLDEKIYTKEMLSDLYSQRWQIETDLRHLKHTLGMHVLRSCTTQGVLKEMLIFMMVYNLVRLVMLRSAQQQKVLPDRISFIDAVRWLCFADPSNRIPDLLINPNRPGRYQPRVIKRSKDEYTKMTKPRIEYHLQRLTKIEIAA